jgi:hypothetical protein
MAKNPPLVKPDRESVPPQVDLYQKRPSTHLDPEMGKAPVVLPRIRAQLPGDVCFNSPSRPCYNTYRVKCLVLCAEGVTPSSKFEICLVAGSGKTLRL